MFRVKKTMLTTAVAALMAVGGGFTQYAQASTVTVSHTFSGNDCSGYFGDSFGACEIFIDVDTDERIKLSPVIAKYDIEEGKTEVNDLYPSIDGDEFSFTPAQTGTWTYTQGADDPDVKYWVAKGGNFFNLFWTVEEEATQTGGACTGADLYNLDCLLEALAVDTGTWETPTKDGKRSDLSHLTFYDTVPPAVIPVPAAGLLLITALGGLGLAARRRRKT